MKLPNVKVPCKDCPFRKDTLKGWLGYDRITEILAAPSFTCHKTEEPNRLQCAGHMLLKGDENEFVRTAKAMTLETSINGRKLVFDNDEDCIKHHSNL